MEVQITPEHQAQLLRIGTASGLKPEQLVSNILSRYLDDEARLLAGVERGLAAAERGEFIEEEEMQARFEAMMKR